jgi:2-oxoglutarate/2-oxoacid ferredoxin oxidoreductase subunit beta
LPLGIFYINPRPVFEENLAAYHTDKKPLYNRKVDMDKLRALLATKK